MSDKPKTTRTFPWDAAEMLDTPEAQAEYLALVEREGDPAEMGRAAEIVRRARIRWAKP